MLIHQEALLDVVHVLVALLQDTGLSAANLTAPAAATSHPVKPGVSKSDQVVGQPSQGERVLLSCLL